MRPDVVEPEPVVVPAILSPVVTAFRAARAPGPRPVEP